MKQKTSNISTVENIINLLLENRGIKTAKDKKEFLNPELKKVTPESVGIDLKELQKSLKRIEFAIKNKEQIVVFGDYDADGLCASAIFWEALTEVGAKVLPYIPSRSEEGYGLSIKAIENLKLKIENVKLIITVDNGITANDAVDFAIKEKIDVIITDHHLPSKELPKAHSIVHTTKLCGAGIAWLLSQQFAIQDNNYLELAAIATVADLVPLIGGNRAIVRSGLEALRKTKRVGLLELLNEAALEKTEIGTYEIGHIIAPRLNAAGRIADALDSLRLLCTKDKKRAHLIAKELGLTNRERQGITMDATEHASTKIKNQKSKIKKLIFVSDENYQQGIIGLIAGRLAEEFYRPTIVISKGEVLSKASARSVKGFNIIEFIRNAQEFLVNSGGHPMAAGFTVETAKLPLIEKKFQELAEKLVSDSHLIRKQRIDCEIILSAVSDNLYEEIKKLEPFGMGNPLPIFESKAVIEEVRTVGQDGKHLKLRFNISDSSGKRLGQYIDGIGFGLGEEVEKIHVEDTVKIIYSLDQNIWNGNKRLQLKIKRIDVKSAA
jgi:single-stranded-DNA-specific exonuclease